MKRVLFVDDEVNVLQGLQRLLRPMRNEWQMTFASGGQEALDALSKEPFDVLVSDMRMPGVDGLRLMNEVRREYPHIVRIVLSGHMSEETSVRLADAAHQYLAKPCDPEQLKQTIDRAFALRDLLADESLKQLISRLKSVPSMPGLYTELIEELNCPDASVRRIGEIISQDPGMTAKILQLVNSAFFGIPRQVSSPAQAANLLGTDTLKTLVLSIGVFSQFRDTACGEFKLESVWKHSAETGAMARQIAAAEHASREVTDAAAMAGLLHDVGKLVLVQNLPQRYQDVMASVQKGEVPLLNAECREFGATHAEVGAYLLGLWGLPQPIIEAVAFHHRPGKSLGKSFSPLTAVHVANVFTGVRQRREGGTPSEQVDLDYLAQLGLTDRVSVWRDVCSEALHEGGDR